MTIMLSAHELSSRHFPNLTNHLDSSDLPGARRVLNLSLLGDQFIKQGVGAVDVSISAMSGRHAIIEVRDMYDSEIRIPEFNEALLLGLLDEAAPVQCAVLSSELFRITSSEDGRYRTIALKAAIAPSILGEAAVERTLKLGALEQDWADTL